MSSEPLKIIFAGTPEFAAVALKALLENSSHKIIAVYTQPDRPAGRGRKLTASPVKELAFKNNIPVHQPETLRDEAEQKILADMQPDVMVVAAYGLLLPLPVLNAPRYGCINIHASLLPRWRGAAPIQRAILAGDERTGITIMQMEQGLDTGPMLRKAEIEISHHNSKTLHDVLAVLGGPLLLEVLDEIDTLKPEIQDEALVTYAQKIKKEEAQLNWNLSAEELERTVRAFNPWPVASTLCGEQVVRIWEARSIITKSDKAPGTILDISRDGIDVVTGDGVLRMKKLQFPNANIVSSADICNSPRPDFTIGKTLG